MFDGSEISSGRVGGVRVIVPPPVAITVAADASKLSILMSCVITPCTDNCAAVRRPNDPSNFGSVTVAVQSVVLIGTLSQSAN